jgi:hypothetical protein
VIDNGSGGKSEPFSLGNIIRLPQIDDFKLTPEQAATGTHVGVLTGRNLEMIGKVGWEQITGSDVPGLPSPIPGQGQKQSLRVNLPDPPSPHATIYISLRGEKTGRITTITNSAPPANNSQAPSTPPSNNISLPGNPPLPTAPPPLNSPQP